MTSNSFLLPSWGQHFPVLIVKNDLIPVSQCGATRDWLFSDFFFILEAVKELMCHLAQQLRGGEISACISREKLSGIQNYQTLYLIQIYQFQMWKRFVYSLKGHLASCYFPTDVAEFNNCVNGPLKLSHRHTHTTHTLIFIAYVHCILPGLLTSLLINIQGDWASLAFNRGCFN